MMLGEGGGRGRDGAIYHMFTLKNANSVDDFTFKLVSFIYKLQTITIATKHSSETFPFFNASK